MDVGGGVSGVLAGGGVEETKEVDQGSLCWECPLGKEVPVRGRGNVVAVYGGEVAVEVATKKQVGVLE